MQYVFQLHKMFFAQCLAFAAKVPNMIGILTHVPLKFIIIILI